jgi:polysaccharide pyruvyl transferase WcaK-like protein
MRIVVFNVKYSPNLGDGLLSECLEGELRTCGDDVSVVTVDIAGRTDYGVGNPNRRAILRVLEMLPRPVRHAITKALLTRVVERRVLPGARRELAGADAAVLGGGNLIADADLNFPIKVHAVMGAAIDAGVPVAVFGVGVSDHWSAEGTRLFVDAFTRRPLAHAVVRDQRSLDLWDRHLVGHGARTAQLCRDPGLLAVRHFPVAKTRGDVIALCLTDPLLLRYHGARGAGAKLDAWMVALAAELTRRGRRLVLFTNGSPEDRTYMESLTPRIRAECGDAVSVAPHFDAPGNLARFIGGCGLVIAHRMHACIAAYSYGVPNIGLAWDVKLDSFFASVGRSDFMIDPATVTTADAAALAQRALAEGISTSDREAVIAEARDDVARACDGLRKAVAR